MASNSNNYFPSDRHVTQWPIRMYQVGIGTMEGELDALTKQIESPIQHVSSPPSTCEKCGTTCHTEKIAIEEANIIAQNQNNSYSSHYNAGWREHPKEERRLKVMEAQISTLATPMT
ncbi:hypothetical protein CR513_56202, partial [Mucuna pruriens]